MNHVINTNDIIIMFIIMIIAGIFSGMNMWVSNINDVRIQINDIYMSVIMTGWMFLLMGIFYSSANYIWIGIITIAISFYFIRNQIFINQYEYLNSMIPHHSMAIMMSKKLLQNSGNIKFLVMLYGLIFIIWMDIAASRLITRDFPILNV